MSLEENKAIDRHFIEEVKQQERVTAPPKPRGLLKWAYNLPQYLYRWHLGWLLGHRCLMITHLGRKTGRRRQTVLEAVNYDPAIQQCVVMAAYGEQSDWYRNIQAHPALEIQVGGRRYIPQQRFLSSEETLAILQEYRTHYPRAFRSMLRTIGYSSYDGSPEGLRALAQVMRGVAFRPQEGT
jgi:deazaflavin-dependent oxidoreductase (nitroreductase family)